MEDKCNTETMISYPKCRERDIHIYVVGNLCFQLNYFVPSGKLLHHQLQITKNEMFTACLAQKMDVQKVSMHSVKWLVQLCMKNKIEGCENRLTQWIWSFQHEIIPIRQLLHTCTCSYPGHMTRPSTQLHKPLHCHQVMKCFCFVQNAGWSALFFAAEAGDLEIVKMLVTAKANISLKDKVSS